MTETTTTETNPTIHDCACALVCAMISLKASHRAEALLRAGWGAPKTVERSRGYGPLLKSRGWRQSPIRRTTTVEISDLYTCVVTRDYLLEQGVIKVSKNGAMRLVNRQKACEWVEAMKDAHNMHERFSNSYNMCGDTAPTFRI